MSRIRDPFRERVETAGFIAGRNFQAFGVTANLQSEHHPALHFQPLPSPWFWWSEQGKFSYSEKPVDAERCLLRFCSLGSASDEKIHQFALKYGILGIWPARVHLSRLRDVSKVVEQGEWQLRAEQFWRAQLEYHESLRSEEVMPKGQPLYGQPPTTEIVPGWREQVAAEWHLDPHEWEATNCSGGFYACQRGVGTWYGEPLALWRRIADYLRTLLLIAASLQAGQVAANEQWTNVIEPMFPARKEWSEGDAFGWNQYSALTTLQVQQAKLAQVCGWWMQSIRMVPVLAPRLAKGIGADPLELEVSFCVPSHDDDNWHRAQYESCLAEQAWERDLRSESSYTNLWEDKMKMDAYGFHRVTMRSSRLLNILILQLASMIASPIRTCSVCEGPASGLNPPGSDGFRRRARSDRGVQCSDECRREAFLAVKRRSFHKNKSK